MKMFSLILVGMLLNSPAQAESPRSRTWFEKQLSLPSPAGDNAIPQLVNLLHGEDSSIYKYMSAQMLFLMDTEASREALEEHMFSAPFYDFGQSIRYAFHWPMEAESRDVFIRKYHLRSSSDQLTLTLRADAPSNRTDRVEFVLTLKNQSEQPLRVYNPTDLALGRYILLISSNGEVMEPEQTAIPLSMERTPEERYILLSPWETCEIRIKGQIRMMSLPSRYSRKPEETLALECGSFIHRLTQPGVFKVYGQYAQQPIKNPPLDHIWKGRVVSEPEDIRIELPNP